MCFFPSPVVANPSPQQAQGHRVHLHAACTRVRPVEEGPAAVERPLEHGRFPRGNSWICFCSIVDFYRKWIEPTNTPVFLWNGGCLYIYIARNMKWLYAMVLYFGLCTASGEHGLYETGLYQVYSCKEDQHSGRPSRSGGRSRGSVPLVKRVKPRDFSTRVWTEPEEFATAWTDGSHKHIGY